MINILMGLVILVSFFLIIYWTGKLSGKWLTDRDEIDEKNYLSKGATIWICIGLALLVSYLIGYIVLNI